MLYLFFSILFVVCLIAANLFETKQFAFFGFSQTAGVIIFPISYIINDVVCEVWGFRKTRQLIWMGFLMNFFFVAAGALCDLLPPAPYYENQAGFHSIFGLAPRITGASFVAFLIGSLLNAYTMSKMKDKQKGKHFSVRAILSTIYGEVADSLIFFPLAFGGIIPWKDMLWLALIQVGLKTIYEIIILPITIQVVKVVKKVDNVNPNH